MAQGAILRARRSIQLYNVSTRLRQSMRCFHERFAHSRSGEFMLLMCSVATDILQYNQTTPTQRRAELLPVWFAFFGKEAITTQEEITRGCASTVSGCEIRYYFLLQSSNCPLLSHHSRAAITINGTPCSSSLKPLESESGKTSPVSCEIDLAEKAAIL